MGKRFLCLILAILIAFSAVGCSKEDLGNARLFDAGQTSDADTFEDLTGDWFCRQMEADPMSCHFTLENPDAYHITFSDQTLCTLTMEEHIKEMDEIKNLLDRLKDIDRNNLTARQRLVYDLMKDYYGLEEKLGDYTTIKICCRRPPVFLLPCRFFCPLFPFTIPRILNVTCPS